MTDAQDLIVLPRPDDFHVHLRDGDMLKQVAPFTARSFGRALVMPNLVPPVATGFDALRYKERIVEATIGLPFTPLMTIALTPQTLPQDIKDAKMCGVIAAKLYPAGATTNSVHGITDVKTDDFRAVLATMQQLDMVLCIHGEDPRAYILDREMAYLHNLHWITESFPALRIVLEHVSTEAGVRAVQYLREQGYRIAATVTVHHLYMTLDDVIGEGVKPHNYCKPVVKTPRDRDALRWAVRNQPGVFFLGTDSAPHAQTAKESCCGAAGCFSAPWALPYVVQLFEDLGALGEPLVTFTARGGAEFYGLPPNEGVVVLERGAPEPPLLNGLVPWAVGIPRWRVREGGQ